MGCGASSRGKQYKHDAYAIAGEIARLEHSDPVERKAAVLALRDLAEKGDANSIAGVTERLGDGNVGVRMAAVEALRVLAEKGDANASTGLTARLGDSYWQVRRAAVDALRVLAEKGDANAIAAVTARLGDGRGGVRRAAVDALRVLAEKGDANAIAAVTARLEDSNGDVRMAAVEALRVLAGKGDANAMVGLKARLKDSQVCVRMAAVEALSVLVEKGDANAIAGVTAFVKDGDPNVARAAIKALSILAEKGDANAIFGLKACSEDGTLVALKMAAADYPKGLDGMGIDRTVPFDPRGDILQNFLFENDVALVRVRYLRYLQRQNLKLPHRQAVPAAELVRGEELKNVKFGAPVRLFPVTHPWLTAEHPDPTGEQLMKVVRVLDELGADDKDLVFYDFVSLYQHDQLHHSIFGNPAWRAWVPLEGECIEGPYVHKMIFENLELCKKHAREKGWGAFVVSDGHAYFKQPSAKACRAASRSSVTGAVTYIDASWHEENIAGYNPHTWYDPEVPRPVEHPALRTKTQDQAFTSSLNGMDKVYASGISEVIVAPSIYDTERIDNRYRRNAYPYINRGWCRTEFGICNFFQRICNNYDSEVAKLLKETDLSMDPLHVETLFTKGEIHFTNSTDLKPVLELYRRYWYAGQKDELIKAIKDGNATQHREGIRSALQALNWTVRHEVAAALKKTRVKELAYDIAEFCLADSVPQVQWHGLWILEDPAIINEIIEKSNRGAAAGVEACLRYPDFAIREQASDILRRIAETPKGVPFLFWSCEGAVFEGKHHTMMMELAQKGDAHTIVALTARLSDGKPVVRMAAVEALRVLAEKGDANAIAGVTACLEDSDPEVRRAAVGALRVLAEKGDANAIAAVTARLGDSYWDVRMAAVGALSDLAQKGDANAIAAVTARLGDSHGAVRRAAVGALRVLAETGDANAIAAVTARLEDNYDEVRRAAVDALRVLAEKGDANAIAAVTARLGDSYWQVRMAAVGALRALAEKGDANAIAAVTARLKYSNGEFGNVRREAVEALSDLAQKGDANAIAAVTARLEDSYDDARRAAVDALRVLAEKGNANVIAAVTARLGDSYWDVRRAAVEALSDLAQKGDANAIAGVTARLEDSYGDVRRAAVGALRVLAEKGDANVTVA